MSSVSATSRSRLINFRIEDSHAALLLDIIVGHSPIDCFYCGSQAVFVPDEPGQVKKEIGNIVLGKVECSSCSRYVPYCFIYFVIEDGIIKSIHKNF